MFRKLTGFSVVLALVVIVLGSYIRVFDAQLDCRDGLDCYGKIAISDKVYSEFPAEWAQIQQTFDLFNANKELIYRSLEAVLGLLILSLSLLSWHQRDYRLQAMTASLSLILLAGLQAWVQLILPNTVTIVAFNLAFVPIVAFSLALLGMASFWLLFRLYLRSDPDISVLIEGAKRQTFLRFAMLIVLLQIVLGVWLAVNHGALACHGFPLCNGQAWPTADYRNALNLFAAVNDLFIGYSGDISFNAQVAVNWLHRVGALACFIVMNLLVLATQSAQSSKPLRKAGLWLSILLFVEIGLGVIGYLSDMTFLWVMVTHYAVAALLMLPLIAISFYSKYGFIEPRKVVELTPVTAPVAPIAEEVYVEPEPESLYLRLKSQLKRTRSGLSGVLAGLSIGQKGANDDFLEEIEAGLLMADVGIDATTDIINRVTQRLERHQLNDGIALNTALKQVLLDILKPCSIPLQIPERDTPFVILVVGVNGAGKTTTIGKLAKRLQIQGKSVMLAAGDTFRAAAVEQLEIWGERNNIHVVAQHTGADSASVIYDAVQSAKAKGIDVLIADTAGRLHTKSNLMDELKKVKRIMGKLDETAPHEVLLVLDAGTGQNALSQAKLFNEAVALTGLVLTKLDGTAKGGVIFALAKYSGIPIRYIGIGERIDDLQDFDAENFVDALFVRD